MTLFEDPLSTILAALLLSVVGGYAIAAAARYPQPALLAAIPVLMWPATLTVAGIPVQQPVCALLAAGILYGCRDRLKHLQLLIGLVAGFAVLAVASALTAGEPQALTASEARNQLLTLLLNLTLVVCVAAVAPDPVTVLTTIAVTGTAAALYLCILGTQIGGRLTLDGLNANAGGHAAAITTIILIGLAVTTLQWWWLLCTAPPLWVVAASQSRGALVVLAAGLAAILIATRRGKARTACTVLIGATVLALWTPLSEFVSQEILTSRDANYLSTDARTTVLHLAGETITTHPWLGIGTGRFLDYSAPYIGTPLNTHNDWIRVAVECGLPALLLLVALLAIPILRPAPGRHTPIVAAAITAGTVSLLLSNTMTDLRVSLPLWALVGVTWTVRQPIRLAHPARASANTAPTLAR